MQEKTTPEQQKKELQVTLAKFAHELRNPMSLIQSELQLMASHHPEVASFDHWDSIQENLEHVRELLDELTKYNNAGQFSPTPTDTAAFLKHIAVSFKPSLDYLGIRLDVRIPDTLPALALDQTKIRQAFLNVLRNAQESIHHSHGVITLSASAVPGGVSVTIRDNGCGMTKAQLQNIYRPFVTYKPSGTGLGLSVTRQIIEAHGGSLDVQSAPEKGTSFRIFLRG